MARQSTLIGRIPGEVPDQSTEEEVDQDNPEGVEESIDMGIAAVPRAVKPGKQGKQKLPRPQDIDTDQLDRAVLTTEGWLCSTKPPARNDTLR